MYEAAPTQWGEETVDSFRRLVSLLKDTKFKSAPGRSSRYPLMDVSNHNLAEWDKLNPETQQRAIDLLSAIMADIVQPLALKQFGNTSDSAIKTVLLGKLIPENELVDEINHAWQQVRHEALDNGLTEAEVDKLHQQSISRSHAWVVDYFTGLISQWQLLPRITARKTADTLATMFAEVDNADATRNNCR